MVAAAVKAASAASKVKKMKLTKSHLRKIIKEERTKLLSEQSREKVEGEILADLSMISDAVQEIANGMFGLVDPAESPRHESNPLRGAGDELSLDLEMQVERLNDLFTKLQRHFESMDPGARASGAR